MNDINAFFAKYVNFTDSLCDRLGYSSSIRHLLYVIIPAFIIKYGIENEKTVIECFRNTKIYTKKDMSNGIEAYFAFAAFAFSAAILRSSNILFTVSSAAVKFESKLNP